MRAIMVCVDYSDILSITLPYNRHHFEEMCIVGTPDDHVTRQLASRHQCVYFGTNAFYDDGADFNKWKALELGLDSFGRSGWLALLDADVLWPAFAEFLELITGNLYTPRRRMMTDLGLMYLATEEATWNRWPLHRNDAEFAGYSQIFHADDPALGPPPWHEIDWMHGGGADSMFQRKWPPAKKIRTDWEVLHIGQAGANWCGRATTRLDGTVPEHAAERLVKLRKYVRSRRHGSADPYAAERIVKQSQNAQDGV